MTSRTIRILAIMEGSFVTGPAKNLIQFAVRAARPEPGFPRLDFAIATFQRGTGELNRFAQAVKDAGIPLFLLSESRRFDTAPMAGLRDAVSQFRPNVLQSHHTKSHLFVRLLKLYRQYPWIAFNHGYTATDWKDRLYNQLDRYSLRAARQVITTCGPFAQKLQRFGVRPEKLHVQHNSVKPFQSPSPEEIAAVRNALRLGSDRIVLAVGRLSAEKGHADLLEAIAILVRQGGFQNCQVVLVGDGPERGNLARQAARLEITGQVCFAGQQSDVRPFYAMASVLALPSHSEGSPNVVLEAMAAGVPIAAAAVGGVPEILDADQTGLLVPARDIPAMASAIRRLLDEEDLAKRLSQAACQKVSTRYTPEVHYRSLVRIYEEVLR